MPQTRLARNQRLRGNRQTELVSEVIPLCRRSGRGVQCKESMREIRRQDVLKWPPVSRVIQVLAVFLISLASFAQDPTPPRGRLSLPGRNWGVVLDLTGFTVKIVETKSDGRRYMFAVNETTHVEASLTLESLAPGHRANSCRDSFEKRSKDRALKIEDVRFSRSGDLDVMQYIIPHFNGSRINHKSIFACRLYDNAYVDLHVSKNHYETADDPLLEAVINSMRIEPVHKSSSELIHDASILYLRHDFKGAIVPYSQALELEKLDPKLGKPLWYVLVDNLGMSYGMTGNLQKARETFDYGVSKDPTYPLFYYNLACTYAEMNDVEKASAYLKKAFEYKANAVPGEGMPDPRTDDSFRKLMKNREFRELANTLAQSR